VTAIDSQALTLLAANYNPLTDTLKTFVNRGIAVFSRSAGKNKRGSFEKFPEMHFF